MSRWIELPVPVDAPRPPIFEGDLYRVRTAAGTVRTARWVRTPGGGKAFVDRSDRALDVVAVEMTARNPEVA